MNGILLVARREFRQIVAMKSFWLTLLLLPVAFALGPLLATQFEDDEATRVIILDRSQGDTAQAVRARFELEDDRAVLADLSRHVRRYSLEAADPSALWAQHDRWYGEEDVAAFRRAGGLPAALAAIEREQLPDTPKFDLPTPSYAFIDAPSPLDGAPDSEIDEQAQAVLGSEDEESGADLVVLVGSAYPQQPVVRVFANDQPRPSFLTNLQDVLTRDLRAQIMVSEGLAPQTAEAVQTIVPAIAVITPPPGGGAREAVLVRSIVPLALSYILMMALLLSGSWMLQSSVEERSNKLLESLLACIRPEELMYGKLIGTLAVGLSMLLVWLLCAAAAIFWTQGEVEQFIRPALAPVSSPGIVLAIVYFFLAGYVSVSIIFLAIGAISKSMSEAQGFLMPVLLAILLPITILLQAIIAGNDGIIVQVLTWVPLWTPFAVLARLGSGIATWELVGAGTLLAAFIVAQFVLLGRLFRASLLAQGQKPSLRVLYERMRSSN